MTKPHPKTALPKLIDSEHNEDLENKIRSIIYSILYDEYKILPKWTKDGQKIIERVNSISASSGIVSEDTTIDSANAFFLPKVEPGSE